MEPRLDASGHDWLDVAVLNPSNADHRCQGKSKPGRQRLIRNTQSCIDQHVDVHPARTQRYHPADQPHRRHSRTQDFILAVAYKFN